MKHLISSRTALCLCGLTLCFNASAQGYVSYNHDAAKMNQITVQEIGAGGLTPAFFINVSSTISLSRINTVVHTFSCMASAACSHI